MIERGELDEDVENAIMELPREERVKPAIEGRIDEGD
jgi:hypothetical protein